jgi:hypothetical protein
MKRDFPPFALMGLAIQVMIVLLFNFVTHHDGPPWTVLCDQKPCHYSFTDQNGNRTKEIFGDYDDARGAMLLALTKETDRRETENRKWRVASKPEETPAPPIKLTAQPGFSFGVISSSGTLSIITPTPSPKPATTPLRIYSRDGMENWLTVIQRDPDGDKKWSYDNAKIESRARPFVRPNKLTGGWTIEFVDKAAGAGATPAATPKRSRR